MKKWIITIAILIMPLLLYYTITDLSNNQANNAEIQAAYAQSNPCVYKFSSSMCLDCKEQEKIVNAIKPKYEGRINFIDYKVDNSSKEVKAMLKKYGISLVPTMIFVDANGKETLKVEGLMSEEELEKQLKALLNE